MSLLLLFMWGGGGRGGGDEGGRPFLGVGGLGGGGEIARVCDLIYPTLALKCSYMDITK